MTASVVMVSTTPVRILNVGAALFSVPPA